MSRRPTSPTDSLPDSEARQFTRDNLAINEPGYWSWRFEHDWEENGGPDQTVFFARLALEVFPAWLNEAISRDALSIYDFGCALGDALPVLAERFSTSALAGGDVAEAGINRARARHPAFRFDLLDPAGPLPPADAYYCSNTLEHLTDWRDKLAAMAAVAAHHVVVLVPYAERELIQEHVTSYFYASLPPTVGYMALSYVSTFDTSRLPQSRWPGRQLLAVYSNPAAIEMVSDTAPRVQIAGDTVRFDARGLPPQTTAAILLVLDVSDAKVSEGTSRVIELGDAVAQARLDSASLCQAKNLELAAARRDLVQANADLNAARAAWTRSDAEVAMLRGDVESLRVTLETVLSSTTWQATQRAIAFFARLCGRRYQAPTMPPLRERRTGS